MVTLRIGACDCDDVDAATQLGRTERVTKARGTANWVCLVFFWFPFQSAERQVRSNIFAIGFNC